MDRNQTSSGPVSYWFSCLNQKMTEQTQTALLAPWAFEEKTVQNI